MNVLVTGCAGFIGSIVCAQLLAEGHAVVGVDNLNSAYDPRLKHRRLATLEGSPGFQFHSLDITEPRSLDELFMSGFDAVVNLGARAGVRPSTEDPWAYFETNLIGTLNLLESCRHAGVRKFVLASTSSLYGAHNARPFREDADTNRPLSPYAASKKAAEAICYAHHHLYGIDVTVLRYFTVYGPAGRPDMSIFRFIRWIAEGDLLTLYGDGTQERDFTYVDDIARGTVLALRPLGYETINLGNDQPASIQHVIGVLEGLLGKEAKINQQPAHPADVAATWADISNAKRLLGWSPRVSLEDGLAKAVEWYQTNRNWAVEINLD